MSASKTQLTFHYLSPSSSDAKVEYHFSPRSTPRSEYVAFVSKGKTTRMDVADFGSLVHRMMEPSLRSTIDVFDEAISGLLRNRDFLGLQLDHAWGNVAEDEFNERAEPYLTVHTCESSALAAKVEILHRLPLSSKYLDAETISTIFGCSMNDTERAFCAIEEKKSALSPKHG